MAAGPHVSLSAEAITHIGGLAITNSIFTSLIVSVTLITLALIVNAQLKTSGRPKGLQNIFEMVIDALYSLTQDVAQNKRITNIIAPLATSFFLFIILNNWLGLLPGVGTIGVVERESVKVNSKFVSEVVAANVEVLNSKADTVVLETESATQPTAKETAHAKVVPLLRAGTADLNTTIALALISVFATQFIGIKELGLSYFKKFINFSSPINFFIGLLESISEVSKIISFAFRLFGNIFAGEVLLAVIAFLIPIVAPMPFLILEIFIGFVQALVFAMLTIVFMYMATLSHDHEE